MTLTRTGLNETFVADETEISATEVEFVHRWIETQGIGGLRAIGAGVKSGFEVTDAGDLDISISAGLSIATHATMGAVVLEKSSATSMTLSANSTLYVFATIENTVSNKSQRTAVPLFVAQEDDVHASGNALARIVTDADSITSIEDLRNVDAPNTAFTQDVANTSGLDFAYYGGIIQNGATVDVIADGDIALADDDTSYVEVSAAGVVSSNTSGFTSGKEALYEVVTAGGAITSVTNRRPDLHLGSGVSSWNDLTDKPTTVAGSGIADAATTTSVTTEATTRANADTALGEDIDEVADDLAAHIAEDAPHLGHMDVDGSKPFTSDVSMGGNVITNLADGVNPTDAATVQQVDALADGYDDLPAVKAISTTNLSLTGLQTIDTVSFSAGERVLLVGQTTQSQNGPWLQQAGAWTRPTDFPNAGTTSKGMRVFVVYGTNYEGTSWTLLTDAGTIDTTALVWTQTGARNSGDVAGPASATDSDIVAFDGTTGKRVKAAGSTTAGRALLTAANAGAQRTALGLGTIATVAAPSGAVVGTSDTQTLTSKRITRRVTTEASNATPSINSDNVDMHTITALAANISSVTVTGTPTEGQLLQIAITGTATRTIAWGSNFEASSVALPTTTNGTNRLDTLHVWNSVTSKWRCLASA